MDVKCFTLGEKLEHFLRVQLNQSGEAVVAVGDRSFVCSGAVRDRVTVSLAEIDTQLQDESLAPHQKAVLAGIYAAGWLALETASLPSTEGPISPATMYGRCSRALLLVTTEPGEGGTLEYTSRTYREVQETEMSHVSKVYNPFPATGVQELAAGGCARLFLLAPRSGFRMVRDGDLAGAPPVITVGWTGSTLQVQTYHPSELWRARAA
jgi:hypothetical protein